MTREREEKEMLQALRESTSPFHTTDGMHGFEARAVLKILIKNLCFAFVGKV